LEPTSPFTGGANAGDNLRVSSEVVNASGSLTS